MMQAAQNTPTRDRLIVTAMDLFRANGYERTSVAEILDKANANSGSFYYFFDTKKDLLLAVLERYKTGLYPMLLDPIWDNVRDPVDRVFALLNGYRQFLIMTDCTYGCPIGNLALEMGDTYPDVREKIAENFEGWRVAVRKCLDEVDERFPARFDRDKLATFVLTVMEGGVMQSRAKHSLEPFDASVTMLRDYFDRLLSHNKEKQLQ